MIDRRDPHRRRNRPIPELLEDRRLLASLAQIANFSVPAQQGYTLPLDGSGTADVQTFRITRTSGSADLSASIPRGPFWTINVQYTDPNDTANNFSGPLVFQLFQDLTPNTVSQIQKFINDGYYTGKNFARITAGFPTANDDIVQAGAPNTNGTGSSGQPSTPFLNENVQTLAFTGKYQLAMANAGVNTSLPNASQGVNTDDTQFFVTTTGSPNGGLGYGYTIFGQLLSGQATLMKMTQVPRVFNSVYGETSLPANPIIMSSLSLSATSPSGVALIDTTQARPGDTATFQVTATDPTDGSTVTRSFTVTAGTYAGPTDPAIDFKPLADPVSATVANGILTNVALVGHDGYPDPNYPGTLSYSLVSQPSHGTISQFNATTGTFVYTPQAGYSGQDSIQYEVQEHGPPPPIGRSRTTGQWLFGPAVTTTSAPATVALTVTSPATTPTITWPNPADISNGTALSDTQLNAQASVPGTYTYRPAPGTVLKAGAGQTLSVSFTPTDTVHYTATSATVSINVNRATPTITWARPAGITDGTALSPAQLDATASVPGTFSYTPAAGTVLKAGAGQMLLALFTPTDLVNYTTASARVTIDVAGTTPTAAPTGTPTPLGPLTGVDRTTSNKHQVTAVTLTFDGSIDPSAASIPATYQLIKQGKHGSFIAKGKAKIKIKSVSYDPTKHTVTLIPRKPFAPSKPVQVLIGGKPVGTL